MAPVFSRSVARPRGHRAKEAMVYTSFLEKTGEKGIHHRSGKKVFFTIEPQTQKKKKGGLHGGGVYFFLPCKLTFFFTEISGRNLLPELCRELHPESGSVKRHLSRRHLGVLNFKFDFILDGGCTREEKIALSQKRHLFLHRGRKPKAFWINFSMLPPILSTSFPIFRVRR